VRLTLAITLAMLATGCVHKQTPSTPQHTSEAIPAVKSGARTQPYYPAEAMAKRIEGTVKASYTVNTKGCADNITILSAQPADLFEDETIKAMKKWCGMKPTPLPTTTTITFRLNGDAGVKLGTAK
jgi:protein TonB